MKVIITYDSMRDGKQTIETELPLIMITGFSKYRFFLIDGYMVYANTIERIDLKPVDHA